jgi:hypothetical protein
MAYRWQSTTLMDANDSRMQPPHIVQHAMACAV